jgi:hypothetical protein
MIELNKKTQQDFLNREWIQRLLDAGVDMSDAKYIIAKDKLSMYDDEPDLTDYIWYKESTAEVYDVCPTYTVSELLYKLHEWIYPIIKEVNCIATLKFIKAGNTYSAAYELRNEDKEKLKILKIYDYDWFYLFAKSEYPIESLASLLIQCHKKDIGLKTKDTGNISDK